MKGMDYRVFVPIRDSDKIVEMVNWCYANVDANHILWDWSYVDDSDLNSDVHFYFRRPEMATFFALKWS